MKLYENVVIGNFLFSLGFTTSAKNKTNTILTSINLLQQTPADKLLADVLLEFSGFVRLIEFKNKENKSKKEFKKNEILQVAIANRPQKKKVSRHIHWYIETDPKSKSFVSYIAPYLDAFPPPADKKQYCLDKFTEDLADEAVKGEDIFTPDELRGYLRLVACLNGSGKEGSDEIGTGGLLIALNSSGGLHYAQLNDMMQLRLQDREFVNCLVNKIEVRHKYEQQKEQARQKALERSLSKGHGLSL